MDTTTFREFVSWGLKQADNHFDFFSSNLIGMLEDLGEQEAADWLKELTRAGVDLNDLPGNVPPRGILAISLLLQLLNLSEEFAANETRHRREKELGLQTEPGLWGKVLKRLNDVAQPNDVIQKTLLETQVEVVFTKHPTEAKRWPVLGLHRELYDLLKEHQSGRRGILLNERCRAILERLWRTGEIFLEKPSVEDELTNLLYYLENVLPSALQLLDQRFQSAWRRCWPDTPIPPARNRPRIRFGSWVGGDRDGHPLVTAEVTQTTLNRLKSGAMRVLNQQLQRLSRALPFSTSFTPLPESFQPLRDSLKLATPDTLHEPWAAVVTAMQVRLPDGVDEEGTYASPDA